MCFVFSLMKCADKADRECRWALSLSPEIFLTLHRCVCFWQVGCMPWLWGSANTNSSIIIIDVDSGANHTMAELPCDGARYAFLSCVVGTLTLALFLRVSWMPKMALMLLLGVLYLTVLELSGFRKTAGWEVTPRRIQKAQTHSWLSLKLYDNNEVRDLAQLLCIMHYVRQSGIRGNAWLCNKQIGKSWKSIYSTCAEMYVCGGVVACLQPTHSFIFHPLKQHTCLLVPNQKPKRTMWAAWWDHVSYFNPVLRDHANFIRAQIPNVQLKKMIILNLFRSR